MTRRRKRSKPRGIDGRPIVLEDGDPRIEPDWLKKCSVCGGTPILPLTGLCGPCTFGESDTAEGNW
jgi:hypothetical protein